MRCQEITTSNARCKYKAKYSAIIVKPKPMKKFEVRHSCICSRHAKTLMPKIARLDEISTLPEARPGS